MHAHQFHHRRKGSGKLSGIGILIVISLIVLLLMLLFQEESKQDSTAKDEDSQSSDSAPADQTDSSPMTTEVQSPAEEPPPDREARESKLGDADQAEKQAQELYRKSREHSRSGKHNEAVADAIAAWEIAKKFPDDPECRDLSLRIESELSSLADKSNRSSGARTSGNSKTLISR